jgi:Flp pilus assembly secretin CpaC
MDFIQNRGCAHLTSAGRKIMFRSAKLAVGLAVIMLLGSPTQWSKAQSLGNPIPPSEPALETVTYSVADLVIPINMEPGDKKNDLPSREDELMKLIRATVAPQTWSDKGGQGTMQYFSIGMGLVIQQTPERHEKIRSLLADLRRLQDMEVAVEIRLINLSEGYKEKFEGTNPAKDNQGNYRLNASQALEFVKFLQEDKGFNIMQAPKLTVFNGQKAKISLLDQQTFLTRVNVSQEGGNYSFQSGVDTISLGQSFSVRPTVSPDKKHVNLNLGVYLANLDGAVPLIPITTQDSNQKKVVNFVQQPKVNKIELEKTLKIANGENVLIHLGRNLVERRTEYGPPVLSKIPYMSRLFRNTAFGREATDLFVMVTPRIIINEENEKVAVQK